MWKRKPPNFWSVLMTYCSIMNWKFWDVTTILIFENWSQDNEVNPLSIELSFQYPSQKNLIKCWLRRAQAARHDAYAYFERKAREARRSRTSVLLQYVVCRVISSSKSVMYTADHNKPLEKPRQKRRTCSAIKWRASYMRNRKRAIPHTNLDEVFVTSTRKEWVTFPAYQTQF